MQSYMHTTEEQSGKKPLYFEAYPQAQLGAENDNSNVGKEPTAPVHPVAPRGYVSQFNHVHRNVPRDKDDAPDFLTEYLNLDSHVSGAVVQNAVQQQPETYKDNDSAIAEPMVSGITSKHDYSASKDEQSEAVIEVEHNASKDEQSDATESCDLDVVMDSAIPESKSDVVIEEEHNVSNAELSDACELENADVTNEADDTKSDRANEPHATESSESSLDIEVSKNAIADEANETPKLDAAPTKRKSRASKASSRIKKESDKQKAEEKKAKQKAALKAKAEKKKELERAKAAAKKEAEKLKAAAKREAEKAKAQAKKEAEKAKAAAKREAAKIKEAEKKAAQKAKEAERRAALKERAKAKAIADAEAKEAEIDMEFAHSMLAMIDSGMKKRQRQSQKQSLEE